MVEGIHRLGRNVNEDGEKAQKWTLKEVNTKYTERFGTEGKVWRNRWKTGKRRKGGQLSVSHGNQHLSLQFQKPLVPTYPAIMCTVPWINQHVNRPLYLRKLNLAANLDWGHRGLLTERSQPSGRKPFLSLNQSLHKPMETAAAGATDFVNGGRLRLVIIISSYITCLFFKVLYKHQLINGLLCPMQIHWFFMEWLILVPPLNSDWWRHSSLNNEANGWGSRSWAQLSDQVTP